MARIDFANSATRISIRYSVSAYELMLAVALDADVAVWSKHGEQYPDNIETYFNDARDYLKRLSKEDAEAALENVLKNYGYRTESWNIEHQISGFESVLALARVYVMKKYRWEPEANVHASQWEATMGREIGSVEYPDYTDV